MAVKLPPPSLLLQLRELRIFQKALRQRARGEVQQRQVFHVFRVPLRHKPEVGETCFLVRPFSVHKLEVETQDDGWVGVLVGDGVDDEAA